MALRPYVTSLLGASLLLSSCQPGGSQVDGTFRTDTLPGGMISVENDGTGIWVGETEWKAEEDLRIGTVHGTGPEQFGFISDFTVDQAGNVYVGEAHSDEVRVFDHDGRFLRSLGGTGEGPGEFRSISGLTIGPGENLWAMDGRLSRVSMFSSGGEFLGSHSTRYRAYYWLWEPGFDEEGRLLDWEALHPRDLGESGSVAAYPYRPLRIGPQFQERDSFPVLVSHNSLMTDPPLPRPYSGQLIFHLSADGTVWFAHTEEYRVSRRDLAGDTTLVFSLSCEPELVTPEEREHEAVTWLPGRRIDPSEVNDFKPVLEGLTTSADGYVYVFPHLADVPGGTAVDVFEVSGQYLGRVGLPTKLEWRPRPMAKPGFLYGVTRNEVDVPFLVRIRLGPGVT